MSIASEISRLQTAKGNLRTAIESKGVTVPGTMALDGYAELVSSIKTGTEILKGTFTAINQGDNRFTINFGKTFSSYIFYVEMTAASLALLEASGQTGAKMYACIGRYPKHDIEEPPSNGNAYISYRIKPSDKTLSIAGTENNTIDGSSISFQCQGYNGGANILYTNHDYEYMIIPIEE